MELVGLADCSEGLSNLDALKEKVVAPSILAKRKAQQYRKEEAERAEKARLEAEEAAKNAEKVKVDAKEQKKAAARQESGDRSGVKVGWISGDSDSSHWHRSSTCH